MRIQSELVFLPAGLPEIIENLANYDKWNFFDALFRPMDQGKLSFAGAVAEISDSGLFVTLPMSFYSISSARSKRNHQ